MIVIINPAYLLALRARHTPARKWHHRDTYGLKGESNLDSQYCDGAAPQARLVFSALMLTSPHRPVRLDGPWRVSRPQAPSPPRRNIRLHAWKLSFGPRHPRIHSGSSIHHGWPLPSPLEARHCVKVSESSSSMAQPTRGPGRITVPCILSTIDLRLRPCCRV